MRKFTLFLAAFFCCAMMNAETYGLSVGGVQVTSENAADIFGDGTVSYDASLAELTLNNAAIRVDYNEINKGAIVAAGDLTIVVKGQNNYIAVNNLNSYAAAIQSLGALTITSEIYPTEFAKLQIVCGHGCALYAMSGNIWLIREVNIDIKGGSNDFGCIKAMNGNLHIDGATVSMLPAWIRVSGEFLLSASEITSPTDAEIRNGKIVRENGGNEYSNQQLVVISSLLRKLFYGATPKNKGNSVWLEGFSTTESQAVGWIELAEHINLKATPAEGYAFTGWYDKNNQLLSTDNPYTKQLMTENTTLIYAQFEEAFIYTVVGSSVAIFGGEWDLSLKANDMDFDGMVYQLHKEGVYVPAGTVEYKVVLNRHWNTCWPADNATLDIPENATYDISFTYSPDSQEVTANAVKQSQDINAIGTGEKAHKVIKDGQLLIERNGKTYNALGAEVK